MAWREPLTRLLNAGLRVGLPAAAPGLVPGTAARLYRLRLTDGTRVTFSGHLLPVPSALPYPPFPLGHSFAGAAVGHGRAFFDGGGTWFPVVVRRLL